jgi:type III secretion protein R
MFSGIHHPLNTILILAGVGLIPFLVMVSTSFIKIAVVLGLVRNALGVQQIPPNMALYAIALLMTAYIMYPVGLEMAETAVKYDIGYEKYDNLEKALPELMKPYLNFLKHNTNAQTIDFFIEQAKRLWPEKYQAQANETSIIILIPAFLIDELTEAFQMGFLIYLPFVVIDLVVSNILLALGMMMVAPMTISLPFKLLLFVLIDGWSRITESLISTYIN